MSAISSALVGTWSLDPAHTRIGFTVRHAVISTVRGHFGEFSGSVTVADENPASARAQATISAASIDTGIEARDNHLRTDDFFAVEQHPEITFSSTGLELSSETEGVLTGDLTIRGVTRPVDLNVTFNGVVEDPFDPSVTRAGFSATGEINRTDFGIDFNAPLKTGGLAVGEKITLVIDTELVKQ